MLRVKSIVEVDEEIKKNEEIASVIPFQPKVEENSLILIEEKKINKLYEIMYLAVKRCFDFFVSLIALILLVPVFLVVCIAIKKESKGPAIFTQMRIGKNGKLFKLYKFRTMVMNADEKLQEILKNDKNARLEYKMNKKLRDDPRITKVGKFLRNTSIDELPQLLNVLKGEMSLIGPRPYLPREREDMAGYYDYIIKSKPGITGLWQVSGRSNTTFMKRLRIDFKYNRDRNLREDIKILVKTVKVILLKEGAV